VKIEDLANAHIRTLEPYQGGRPIEEVERELEIERAVKLASNEAPVGPSPKVVEAIREAAAKVNRYPDGSCFYLRRALAAHLDVDPDWLFLGAGSDEILEVLAKSFLGAGDEAVFPWPGFAMYPIVTQGMGARPVMVPLDGELRADVARLAAAVTDRTRLLFLPNPNNPTGTSIDASAFSELLAAVPERVVIACDEAYLEYVRRDDFPDTLRAVRERPTLLQLRTFSKIYGLAGLRVGFAIGHPSLIGILERARHPFNVSSLAQVAALAALGDAAHVERVRKLTRDGLAQLERGFDALGLSYAASDANFVLVRVGEDADGLADRLMRRGVITRAMGGFGLSDYIRVTAGLPEENERFLTALRAERRA
jgi:histidinol-phosphate aminotransferase